MCFIQPVWFAVWDRHNPHSTSNWITFLVNFSLFLSSGINPVIYFFRARRFRLALKQLMKDPCGRSSFLETIKRAEQKNPLNITDQATTGKEVHDNTIGEAKNRENADDTNGQRNEVRRLSFRQLESGRRVVNKACPETDENFQEGKVRFILKNAPWPVKNTQNKASRIQSTEKQKDKQLSVNFHTRNNLQC